MTNERGRFSIEFETKKHEIDARAYGIVLMNTVVLIDEISNELESLSKFDVRVVAEKKGSFETELILHATAAVGITSFVITPDNLIAAKTFASKVVSILGQGFDLFKKLKGEPAKSITQKGDKSTVVTGDNNTTTVNNSVINVFVNNPNGPTATSNIFSELADHPEIDGMKLLNELGQEIFEAPKADFPKLAAKNTKKEVKERVRTKKATLTPFRQSYYPTSKSDFLYQGNRIRADIVAEEFWRRVEADEAFAKHDKLIVKLEIREEFLSDLKAYRIKSYRVLELIDHKPVAQQASLFVDDKKSKPKIKRKAPPKKR